MRACLAPCIKGFGRDRAGVSALEFAFVLPLMLTIYIGSFEISQGLSAKTKVSQTARTVTDLVARSTSITTAQKADIFDATKTVMSPFTITNAQFTPMVSPITSIARATPRSVRAARPTATPNYTPGQTVTVPAALIVPSTQLIWGMPFLVRGGAPFYSIVGPITLSDQMYMAPRMSPTVSLPSPC